MSTEDFGMKKFSDVCDDQQERIQELEQQNAVLTKANTELNDELQRHATDRAKARQRSQDVQKLVDAARVVEQTVLQCWCNHQNSCEYCQLAAALKLFEQEGRNAR